MKRKIIISIIAFASLMPACTDLDETLYSEISTSDYGKTPEELITISGAAYASLRGTRSGIFYSFPSGEFVYFLHEVSSDEATIPTRGIDWDDQGVYQELQYHTVSPVNKVIECGWLYCFRGITSCNQALLPIQTSDMDDAAKNAAMAELRGIRAYYYYLLLTWFGNVPITIDYSDLELPATKPKQEVYDFVESELIAILPYLQEEIIYGRITKNVAYGLLARLYINSEAIIGTARWQECIDACNNVQGFSLEKKYFDNFISDNQKSKEIIFAIPFDRAAGTQGNYMFANTLNYDNGAAFATYTGGGNNGICAEPGVYSSFDPTDIRRNAMLIGPQISLSSGDTILMTGHGGAGRPLIYTEEVTPFLNAPPESGARLVKYQIKAAGQQYEADHDFVVMRYAEILMMKAECSVRLDLPANAEAEVHEIRNRIAMPDLTLVGLSKEDQLAALDKEWLHEFLFEGLRRDVNIRFGTYLKASWEKGVNPTTALLFPIPAEEITKNNKLIQNPGY